MNNKIKKIILSPFNVLYKFHPALVLKMLFIIKQGSRLNLKSPKSFNEKINWIKLNYKNDLMPICADKYTVREYVKSKGYEELLTKLYWQGHDPKKIPFDDLPDQFVIKVTHGSGMNILCRKKTDLDIKKTQKTLNKWLKEKYLLCYGEWFYGVVKPSIIIEEYLGDAMSNEVPNDYKMFCFNDINGEHTVGFTAIDIDRFGNHKRKMYDKNWQPVVNAFYAFPNNENVDIKKPTCYEEMVEIAEELSKPFLHARVDLYLIEEKIYFGEITFTPSAGFGKISPRKFHEKMGSWIKLSN